MFIIAEIGINHNGEVAIAKRMIDAAKDCGCDAVKFQKRTIEKVYSKAFLDTPRESPWGHTQYDQKRGLEFGLAEYSAIDIYCKSVGIEWFASAWDVESQEFLRHFNLKYNKVAAPMLVDLEFLKVVASEGRYTFISTGMSDERITDEATQVFRIAKCPFELMHCVSMYPLPDEKANLRRIVSLRERYRCDVGYSGHETGIAISCAATALGITSLERHFTLERTMYGSDQTTSIEPGMMRVLVGSVRKIEQAMGDGAIRCDRNEIIASLKLRERYHA